MTDTAGQTALATLPGRRCPVERCPIRHAPDTRAWGAHRESHIHAGVDLGGPPGTIVRAPEGGTIEGTGDLPARRPWTGYAPAVLMRGDSGRWHLLAHLSGAPVPVVVGQRVELGAELGRIGRERHTHWEVRTRPRARRAAGEETWTITVDPERWLVGLDAPFPQGAPDPDRRPSKAMGALCVELVRAIPDSARWCS